MHSEFVSNLIVPGTTKIALIVMDGLGGLPREVGGRTELETACTPNFDSMAQESALGLTVPAGPGITVGSGPGHLALFGYDPVKYEIGRGALEALGVDFELGPDDVAARGNFCSIDRDGVITDRRAGRIPTEVACQLIEELKMIRVDTAKFFIQPVKEHRFALVMRGQGLEDQLSETDPQKTGVPPLDVRATHPGSERSAQLLNEYIGKARDILGDKDPANMVMLRGFAKLPKVPKLTDLYGLHPAAIALHGMYRGVAKLAGMQVLPIEGDALPDEFATLERHWEEFDLFYLHVKKTDTYGEQGDFDAKVCAIQEVDALMPRLMRLHPDVVVVGGDHSSPAVLKSHSWHPVPVMLYGKQVRPDGIAEFGERPCARGSLGVLPATHILPLALASAGRISKYGA